MTEREFRRGDRVHTPYGRGTVFYKRLAPPTYDKAEAYSVLLDCRPTSSGTIVLPDQLQLIED